MTDTSVARARAWELARAQCTDNEIAATLRLEHPDLDTNALVESIATELLDWRWAGRAHLRTRLFLMADGDKSTHSLTRAQVAALHLFGAQHLGYTGAGMDEKVRKTVERAERDAAKGRKLRAV